MWSVFTHNPVVKFLASLKLAVITIISFAFLMIYGTVMESLHGTEYAQTAVYFSAPFLFVEGLLFVSVLFAALVRLPFKKRLAGFYIIHLGILTLLTGATITSLTGLDGTLELIPEQPNNYVQINSPHLHAMVTKETFEENKPQQKNFMVPLPHTVREIQLNQKPFLDFSGHQLFVDRYLPYATPKSSWEDSPSKAPPTRVIWMELKNKNVTQQTSLSSFSYDDSVEQMGPLGLALFMGLSHDCFAKAIVDPRAKLLYINKKRCLTLNHVPTQILTTDGITFDPKMSKPLNRIIITDGGISHNYYPQLTAYPITDDIHLIEGSQNYLLDLELYRTSPNVVFFGDDHIGYGKKTDWNFAPVSAFAEYQLPWMGFSLTITRLIKNQHEKIEWLAAVPQQGKESAVHRAALVRIISSPSTQPPLTLWIDDQETKTVSLAGTTNLQLRLGPQINELPFKIELDKFNMDTNPGTTDPASFESFVTVHDGSDKQSAHIFMNNPFKRGGFTFYQASYFPLERGGYGSVLSVNRDPGRTLKYAGSFLLVFGSVLHYWIRSRKVS